MSEQDKVVFSNTVSKVLDRYLEVLSADPDLGDEAAKRLDAILRSGKVPKAEDIDAALNPPPKGECS